MNRHLISSAPTTLLAPNKMCVLFMRCILH